MKLSKDVLPISYVKAHASEIIADLADQRRSVVITQNGEAKAVLQDIHLYEQTQESLALLKLIAQGKKNVEGKKFRPVKQAFSDIRKRLQSNSGE